MIGRKSLAPGIHTADCQDLSPRQTTLPVSLLFLLLFFLFVLVLLLLLWRCISVVICNIFTFFALFFDFLGELSPPPPYKSRIWPLAVCPGMSPAPSRAFLFLAFRSAARRANSAFFSSCHSVYSFLSLHHLLRSLVCVLSIFSLCAI